MGSQLGKVVSDDWGHLPAGPYKILMRMALYSLDSSTDPAKPAGHYWRGWQHLAEGLGRKPPGNRDDSPEAVKARKWMKDEVRRHTTTLVEEGAVLRAVDNPGFETRQVWKLTLAKAHDL
jgi:hypothetical protein